ncbi:hypothetical protein HGRIS_012788 [Hohenbuehelia grisea]|uniref:Thioester reductase (TE) domain-containing protein n=1 Tax=Hohenbuehelia grisea TaxID=104357 RepID=A0ABR3ITF6_9AGAR
MFLTRKLNLERLYDSSSGRPYETAKGHSPAWASKVDWQKGDALNPQSFAHLLPQAQGVVHTLGTLIEDGEYKTALKQGDVPALIGSFVRGAGMNGGKNPLKKGVEANGTGSYEALNRDSGLRVCEAFVSSSPSSNTGGPRPFVYISAEDIFQPFIPARYIKTKREAEQGIALMLTDKPEYRPVFIRPSLVYHAHYRPLTTPAAVLLDLSASLHAKVPRSLPTPSSVLRTLGAAFSGRSASQMDASSPLESMANAMIIPPVHVDQVAAAIAIALDPTRTDVRGIINVRRMRDLIGWSDNSYEANVQPAQPRSF